MARILVVSTEPPARDRVVGLLAAAGHDATPAAGFDRARRLVAWGPPDLLIASIRLGSYNGLHLAIRARFSPTPCPAIVIGPPDAVLEAEAERLDIPYLTEPLDDGRLMAAVAVLLTGHRRPRRSTRKRIGRVAAYADGREAVLVDVSYDGLRLEIDDGADTLPAVFTLRVPDFDLACRAERVWVGTAGNGASAAWCGAALASGDAGVAVAWRAFVDAMPGSSVAMA